MLREERPYRAKRIQKSFMKEVALEITLGWKNSRASTEHKAETITGGKSMNKGTYKGCKKALWTKLLMG